MIFLGTAENPVEQSDIMAVRRGLYLVLPKGRILVFSDWKFKLIYGRTA